MIGKKGHRYKVRLFFFSLLPSRCLDIEHQETKGRVCVSGGCLAVLSMLLRLVSPLLLLFLLPLLLLLLLPLSLFLLLPLLLLLPLPLLLLPAPSLSIVFPLTEPEAVQRLRLLYLSPSLQGPTRSSGQNLGCEGQMKEDLLCFAASFFEPCHRIGYKRSIAGCFLCFCLQLFCRMLWDLHEYFSVVMDFSGYLF